MRTSTESGRPFRPVYGPDELAGWDPASKLGEPGEFPYTRGVYSNMYTGRPWTMRQYAGFGTAAESNRRYHHLVAAGAGGPFRSPPSVFRKSRLGRPPTRLSCEKLMSLMTIQARLSER